MLAKAKSNNVEFIDYFDKCVYNDKGSFRDFLTDAQKGEYDQTVGKFDLLYKLTEENLKSYNLNTRVNEYEDFHDKQLTQFQQFYYSDGTGNNYFDKLDILDGAAVNGFAENIAKMRTLVSKIDEYKSKDVFEFTNERCRFVYKSSTVAANDPMAGKSQAGKYCTGFKNVGYSNVEPRYGAAQ